MQVKSFGNFLNARSFIWKLLPNNVWKRQWRWYKNCKTSWRTFHSDPFACGFQFSSVAQLCPTVCDTMDCSMPGFPVHHQLPELAQTYILRLVACILFAMLLHFCSLHLSCIIPKPVCAFCTYTKYIIKLKIIKLVMPSNHLILCYPLLLLPSTFPSIRVFSNKSVLHIRWPKFWSLSFSISPSNEYSGLIFFRNDWFDLLAVQGTIKSLLQHHSSKASILQHSAFFMVQLSHPYMTTGKTVHRFD